MHASSLRGIIYGPEKLGNQVGLVFWYCEGRLVFYERQAPAEILNVM